MISKKDEKLKEYEETKRRFQERNKPPKDINEEMLKRRLLNRLCTLYIVTKPHDLWNNNPFRIETEKYGNSEIDVFKHIPDYYVWFSKQMNPVIKEPSNDSNESVENLPDYEKITMNAVTSTIYKKWRQYTLEERHEIGIPGSKREIFRYLKNIEIEYSKYFKTNDDDNEEDVKENE